MAAPELGVIGRTARCPPGSTRRTGKITRERAPGGGRHRRPVCWFCGPLLLAALASSDRLDPTALRLVQRQVASDRNRRCYGDNSDPRPDGPSGENDQEDNSENDPGYPDLHAWCHDDSIHP